MDYSPIVETGNSRFLYVVPFKYSFDGDPESEWFGRAFECIEKVTKKNRRGEDISVWERIKGSSRGESDLFRHVREEFIVGDNLDEKSGACWIRSEKAGSLPKLVYFRKEDDGRIIPTQVKADELRIYLFRYGYGFVCYGLTVSDEIGFSQLLVFQDEVKELNRNKTVLWEKNSRPASDGDSGSEPETTSYKPFFLGVWVNRNLNFLRQEEGARIEFFSDRAPLNVKKIESDNKLKEKAGELNISLSSVESDLAGELAGYESAPDKAVLFSYVLLKEAPDQETFDSYAYHLATGFTDKYKFSRDVSKEILRPFMNVRWCVTKNGGCYIAYPLTDNKPFFESFKTKFETDYFTLFIKGLYQSYALLLNAEKIQRSVTYEKNCKTEDNLLEEINRFLVKSTAASVSFIQHQCEFFEYVKKQLRISEDADSLVNGFSKYKEEIDRNREKEEDRKQKERDGKRDRVLGLLSVLAVFSAFTDCYDFIGKVFRRDGTVLYDSLWRTVLAIICHIVIFIVGTVSLVYLLKSVVAHFKKPSDK